MVSDHWGVFLVICLLEIQQWTGDSVLQLDHVSSFVDLRCGYCYSGKSTIFPGTDINL